MARDNTLMINEATTGRSSTGRVAQIPSLTGIRGVAAIWVLLYHVLSIGQASAFELGFLDSQIIRVGWAGVDLFFILSGFMLMHRHSTDFERFSLANVWNFAVSRFFRVYPLACIALVLILALVMIDRAFAQHFETGASGNLSIASFAATALLATRWLHVEGNWNEPVWSLSAEIIGYAAFPLLALCVGRIKSLYLTAVIIAGCMEAVIAFQSAVGQLGENDLELTGALVRMSGYFLAGICLRRAAELITTPPATWKLNAVSLATTAAMLILPFSPIGGGFMPIAFAILIFVLYFQRSVAEAILSSRIALFLGKISFPLYLLHVMPLLAFNYHANAQSTSPGRYLIGLTVLLAWLLATAWVLHRWVEMPVHRFARRFHPTLHA